MTLLLAPAVLAAIIAGIASLVGGAMSAVSVARTNKKNIDNQWEMWNATNQYNTALQDVGRMQEAGLNPNLAFGGTPYHASPVNIGNSQPVNFDFLGTSMLNALGMHQQTAHFEFDIDNKALDNLMKNMDWAYYDDKLQREFDLSAQELANLKETFNKIQKEVSKLDSDMSYQNVSKLILELEKAHKQINYNYDRALYEKNLPPDLDPNTRLIVGMISSLLEKISFGRIKPDKLIGEVLGLDLPKLEQ